PVEGVRLFEELATIDSAGAWVAMLAAAGAWLTILLPPEGGDELLADPRAVINGSLFPPLAARRVEGGYRVSGQTSFARGCNHGTWFGSQAILMEGVAPVMGPNGAPVAIIVHLPANAGEIIPNWDTMGMRGTGSHDLRVADAFVPDHRAWQIGPYEPRNPAF